VFDASRQCCRLQTPNFRTYSRRALYDLLQTLHGDTVIELVVPIKNVIHFSIQCRIFPTGCTEKFGLIDRRAFFSNNSVTCAANYVKFEVLMHHRGAYESPQNCRSRSRGSPVLGDSLPKSGKIVDILGPNSHIFAAIKEKFCTAKRTQVPVGLAKFDLHRCNESPLRDETPDFWPCVTLIRRCLTLRGNAAGNKHHIFAPTDGARCAIFSKLCTVTELKNVIHFSIQCIVFPTGCTEKFCLIDRRAVTQQ